MSKQEIIDDFEEITEEMINACPAFASDKEHKLGIAVKLLFDQNISPKFVKLVAGKFPGSTQVRYVGLEDTDSLTCSRLTSEGCLV